MPRSARIDSGTGIFHVKHGDGFWCESNDVDAFTALVDKMLAADRKAMGENGYAFLKANYTVQNTYDVIMGHLNVL